MIKWLKSLFTKNEHSNSEVMPKLGAALLILWCEDRGISRLKVAVGSDWEVEVKKPTPT